MSASAAYHFAPAVYHFGPDPTTIGGMASAIRVLTKHSVGAEVVTCHPTWRPRSPLASTRLAAQAAGAILCAPAGEVAHIHLSERGSFLREGALVTLARRHGLVTVATIHGAAFAPFARRHPGLAARILQRAHAVSCLEEEALAIVQHSAPHTHSEIVPNPVFVDGNAPPADSTDELVVFAGEIGLRKGADVLCRAWRLVAQRRPRARCMMVGPVADFRPRDAERLEVCPAANPLQMAELLRRARVVALPSRAEGMPMVLAEAMSVGRPFVSTPVGAIPEMAHEGGMLVAVGDATALAERLIELLADPALARELGERGRRFCLQTRSIDAIDARLRRLYALASERRASRIGGDLLGVNDDTHGDVVT